MFLIDLEEMKQKDRRTGNSVVNQVRRKTGTQQNVEATWFYEFNDKKTIKIQIRPLFSYVGSR